MQSAQVEQPRTDWTSIWFLGLICLLDSLRISTINMNSWAYLSSLDDSATEQFFGQAMTISTSCMLLTSLITGWFSNRISHTKPPIVLGTFLLGLTILLYANLELVDLSRRKCAFMIVQTLFGVSSGLTTAWRVHVAMASVEKDRSKANSLLGFGIHVGYLIGPLLVLAMGYLLSTQELPMPWGTQLDLYTAPAYLTAAIYVISSAVLLLFFDGRMRKWESSGYQNSNCWTGPQQEAECVVAFDRRAIFACFFGRLCITALIVYMIALSSPYAMVAFGWSGEQVVINFMLIQGVAALLGIVVNLGYTVHLLDRIRERVWVLLSLATFLAFFLSTYPWPFLTSKLPEPLYKNTTLDNGTVVAEKVSDGCDPVASSWCQTTPAINVYIYVAGMIIVHGLAIPLCMLNLDVLYSRLLGRIKQGTMQGLFIALGDMLNVGGPMLIASLYQMSGPKQVWAGEMTIFVVGIAIWAFNYRRLIPVDEQICKAIAGGQAVLVVQAC